MPPFNFDPEYARRYSVCRTYAAGGACTHGACPFNHSIFDTARITTLVGDVSGSPAGALKTPATQEKIYFSLEYTKYSGASDEANPDERKWRVKLLAGGRATMPAGGLGTGDSAGSLSVQPVYPVKGLGRDASIALSTIENRVFGRTPAPDPARPQMCRAHLDGHCRFGSSGSCRFSHTMFDVSRVDVLMDEAVKERGYKDHKPLLEIEYVGRPGEKPMWRVTLRCVVSYSAPEPVVVTAVDLNAAFRLLESQFAGSSGKSQTSPPPQAYTNAHRRASTSASHNAYGSHARTNSTPQSTNARPPPPAQPQHARSQPGASRTTPYANEAPPSYHEAMGGSNGRGQAAFGSKRQGA